MLMSRSDVIDAIRQPEYTGENRCLPCTVVNAAVAAVAAVAIGGVTATVSLAAGVAAGAGALVLFAATISVRGYLVPGTPWLTRTYLPDRVLRWFGKPTANEAAPPGDAEGCLARAGVVTVDGDDRRLSDEFRECWRERIVALRDRDDLDDEAASFLDADPDVLGFEDYGSVFVAVADGSPVRRWESRAAFLADLAAAEVLETRHEEWRHLDVSERNAILGDLRSFLERCPACDGAVTKTRDPVEGCCGSAALYHVVTTTCRSCGALLAETDDLG